MFQEEFTAAAAAAGGKLRLMRTNLPGYFTAAMLAGAYVGFGVLLAFTLGGQLGGAAYTKLLMGAVFGIALSLVIIAGAELFTGNNMVMAAGCLKGDIRLRDALALWGVCWLGNLAGSALLAVIYWGTGLGNGVAGEFMAAAAAGKMAVPPLSLFLRAVLCNVLVCLAVWCGFRCKSESGKLIMVWWCLLAFITTGFEHSVANMTLLTLSLLSPCGQDVSLWGWAYNLLLTTAGNLVGGTVFVALPYFIISSKGRRGE